MYTSAIELNQRFGIDLMIEMAAQAVGSLVEASVFEAVVLSNDTSGFALEDITTANKLLVTINEAINRVTKEVDSYIGAKNELPLSQTDINESVIPMHAQNLVRYSLMIKGADEDASDRRKAAIAWLKDVAKGTAIVKNNMNQSAGSFNVKTAQGVSKMNWSQY